MKFNLFFALAFLCANLFSQNAGAQTAAETEVLKMWNAVWQSYETNDEAKMWSYYATDACEIYPDGNAACGLANIRAGYEMFKTMMEGKPSWTMTTPTVQFIEPTVALLISDVVSDIKLKGVGQIGGKSKFAALVHRVNGQWFIVFDSQTPVLPPSTGN